MKRNTLKTSLFFTFAAGLLIAGMLLTTVSSCNKDDKAEVKYTLYDTLGGTTMVQDPNAASGVMIEKGRLGIRSVVDSAIFIIAADPEINGFFSTLLMEVGGGNLTGFSALSKNLTDFFCVATGAKNFTYGGKNMKDAHDPAKNPRMNGKADSGDFDAFVTDVVAAANKNGLSQYQISRLGAVINSVKSDVVQK